MPYVLFTFITAVLALSAAAVDIDLFIEDAMFLCSDHGSPFIQCSDVDPFTCCYLTQHDVYSARCYQFGPQDICVMTAPFNTSSDPCSAVCNADFGGSVVCLAPGKCTLGKGAFWLPRVPGQPDSEVLPTQCEKTVEPDRVVFPNGQSFHINHDVPAEVSALLLDLARADPHLTRGIPEAAAPYEIKAAKAG